MDCRESLQTQLEADILFVNKVREFPLLYNAALKDYRDPLKKRNAWKIIARELGTSHIECQHRWRNLRERYVKEKKWRMHEIDDETTNRSPWKLFDYMAFLSPYVKHRRLRYRKDYTLMLGEFNRKYCHEDDQPLILSNANPAQFLTNAVQAVYSTCETTVSVPEVITKTTPTVTPVMLTATPAASTIVTDLRVIGAGDEAFNQMLDNTKREPPSTGSPSESNRTVSPVAPSGRAVEENNENPRLERKILETIQKSCSASLAVIDRHRDEDDLFALSIAHSLRRLSAKKKALAKLKIQTILYELQDDE